MRKFSVVIVVMAVLMASVCVGVHAKGKSESELVTLSVSYMPPTDTPLTCSKEGKPKNIIMMIGDGMGLNTMCAARAVTTGPAGKMNFQKCDYTAFASTYSANAPVTDSAASGTALSCGAKTDNGMLGQTPDGQPLKSNLMKAEELGKWTGIVTTDEIYGATPASTYAHVGGRGEVETIARQLLATDIEVVVGGGRDACKDTDGWQCADSADALTKADLSQGKVLALLSKATPEQDKAEVRIDVSELTRAAIEKLSAAPNGFFLLVEGACIDKAAHGNKAQVVLDEMADFDEAIGEALAFAEKDQNTLVVVTADHETGAVSLPVIDEKDGVKKVQINFASGNHTGVMVPVMAAGVGAPQFKGFLDNTDIAKIIGGLMEPEAK